MPASTAARHPDLAAAFRAARYRVETGDGVLVVRIGRRHAFVDRLAGGIRWCILTAFNPRARLASARANRRAHRRLEQRLLDRAPRRLLRASNQDPAQQWPDEPAWWFTFEHDRDVDGLAEAFDQEAVVIGNPGQPARLRFYAATDELVRGSPSE
jgi:hypothetical protein